MQQNEVSADIHHYFVDHKTGRTHLDEDGEPMIGFYYQLKLGSHAIGSLMGPYGSASEAEAAGVKAFESSDYS